MPRLSAPVLALALAVLLASLGISIAAVALPRISGDLDIPTGAAHWIILAYLLATTVASVLAGRLGDLLGRRRILLAGIALHTVAALACALAPGFGGLLAARAVQGVGAAALMALPLSFVRDIVPPQRTGAAMGMLGSTSAIGTALGPSLGGLLLAAHGWRAVFFVLVPLGLAAFALVARSLPAEPEPARKPGLDPIGTVLLGVALATYALALTAHAPWLLLATVASLAAFATAESLVASPLLPSGLLRSAGLVPRLSANVLVSAIMMATLVVGPFYLAAGLGLGDAAVGLVMAVGPATAALSGVPAGRMADRLGAPATVRTGLVLVVIGSAAMATLPEWFGTPGYVGALILLTPGFQLFLAANNTAVMAGVAIDRRGVVSGLLNLSRNLGFITGAAMLGGIFAASSGPLPADMGHGLAVTFGSAAALALAALVLGRAAARPSLA